MQNAKLIISKAKQLRQAFVGNKVPIDVIRICFEAGIQVIKKNLDSNVSGLLVVTGDKKYIFINPSHPKERQRFTIAHELGHLILHRSKTSYVLHDTDPLINFRDEKSSLGLDLEEREANRFAAELLMPEELIHDYLRRKNIHRISEDLVGDMAKVFMVSKLALTIRLTNLGLFA